MIMKTRWIIFTVLTVFSFGTLFAQKEYVKEDVKLPAHPRILLKKGEEKKLLKQVKKDAMWLDIHNAILEAADEFIPKPVSERIKTGRRLLSVSRENLKRIFILSYAYRVTGQEKYFKRAEAEMLKAASFEDWNPSHFLDVGEMTMALAIGYDWLYNKLSADSKQKIETAIIEKGITPSYTTTQSWIKGTNNWNQVCHAGMTYGALAVWEKNPELACKTLNRAIENISIPMKHYAPDGAYPEGVTYWSYGTSFNAMFLSAVEKIFATDFGLTEAPGFLRTGEYILHTSTPSLNNFAYSDCGAQKSGFNITMYWFYDKTKDATILYNQSRIFKERGGSLIKSNRLAPAALIWGAGTAGKKPDLPTALNWKAQGDNPIVCMRGSWTDTNASFLGVKLGSPGAPHGHMDVGSFIFESNGVVWAQDLGSENYNQAEVQGVDMWNKNRDSQRWMVYRYNNYIHNTLTFNKKLQIVEGKSNIDSYVEKDRQTTTVSDLTPVYSDQVTEAKRAFSLVDKKYAVIEDQITASKWFTMMTWTLTTPATPTLVSDYVMMLEKDGKKCYVKVEAPAPIRWKVQPAKSIYTFNSDNPGISVVTFDMDLKISEKQNIKVYLIPEENKSISYDSPF